MEDIRYRIVIKFFLPLEGESNNIIGGKLDMINTNNYSHNRGSEVINQLTDYSDYDNIYERYYTTM